MQIRRRLAHVYRWYLILIGSLFTGITFFKTRPNGAAALVRQQTSEGYKSRETLVAMQISPIQSDGRDCRRKIERHKQTERMWSKLHIWNSDQGGSTKLQLQRLIISRGCIHRPPCEAAALVDTTWLRLVRLKWAVLSIVATIACVVRCTVTCISAIWQRHAIWQQHTPCTAQWALFMPIMWDSREAITDQQCGHVMSRNRNIFLLPKSSLTSLATLATPTTFSW